MQIANFKAEPNLNGGQIDLSWTNPTVLEFPGITGVKILRRESTAPGLEDIGTQWEIFDGAATPAGQPGKFSDRGLNSETVYYYAIVAYDPAAHFSTPALASTMATGAYLTAEHLYSNLPGLYKRYDTLKPPRLPGLNPADIEKGQLRRFVEMFGAQFDLLRSYTAGMRDFPNVDRMDGQLLPLVAQWIGWQNDFSLPFSKERNEIRYAPHFFRTTGVAANLRATLNRLITWDVQIKEFVHNVFLANAPEQLTIHEMERRGTAWQPAKQVTLELAYEGRPTAVKATDGSMWLFYHARKSVPKPQRGRAPARTEDRWELRFKVHSLNEWQAARRASFSGDICKYPAALQKNDPVALPINGGNMWLFWTEFEANGQTRTPRIKLQILAAGQPARPARLVGTQPEPFTFTDGDLFTITINDGLASFTKTVPFHREHFQNLSAATVQEVVALLDRELPGARIFATEDGKVGITSFAMGAAVSLTLPTSSVATQLGLPVAVPAGGADATRAELIGGRSGPFALTDGDTLTLKVDGDSLRTVTFRGADFATIANATAAEVAAVVNQVFSGLARDDGGRLRLTSTVTGGVSFLSVDVGNSTSAAKLGFGASLPASMPLADDQEPATFEDNAGNVWLFWSSRRSNVWKIWYSRLDAATMSWGIPRQLTLGTLPDREPAVVFDPGNGAATSGKIWLFWSRKKANDLWTIFYRTTTHLDFTTLVEANWTELELTPVPADFDKKEAAPVFLSGDNIELFFSSNQIDGWQIWSNRLTPAPSAADTQITTGQFTRRAPAALNTSGTDVHLWFRTNASQHYTSPSYPAAQTVDARYGGSTTVDTRNPTKNGLRRNFQDVGRYIYDTGIGEDNWYARNCVGLFLVPDTGDAKLIIRKKNLIGNILKNFLPIQVRTVFVIQQVFPEFIYTYEAPADQPQVVIGEQMTDSILSETYRGLADGYGDGVNFHWARAWDATRTANTLPDLSVTPPDLTNRTFLTGIEEGP